MNKRIAATLFASAVAGLALCSVAFGAMVGIYRNDMESLARRGELIKISGANCARGGSQVALRVAVGEKTDACAFRTPVQGRDLEIGATQRLLSGTPVAVQRRAYLGLELRAGSDAKYQLLVYPLQRKAQLIKFTPEGPEYFAVAKDVVGIKGVNKANALRLRALNIRSGPEKGRVTITGFVGNVAVVEGVDALPGELPGEAAAVTVGAAKNGKGVIASIDELVVRTPVHF